MINEKDLSNCGCNDGACGCGCDSEHDHEDNHDCGCGCGCGEHESIFVDLQDENGNTTSCEVVDNFTFEDANYVLVQHPEGSVYLFKAVEKGEEVELTVPEEEEFDKASKFYEESMEK